MVFSSNVFLFLFLPAFLAAYYLSPKGGRNALIVLGSYAFYAWWRVDFLLLFIAVTVWNYGIGNAIAVQVAGSLAAKRWTALGVTGDLAVLGYFKYANFGVDSFNTLFAPLGMSPVGWTAVILPIGISFYIFQAISYLVDVYRGDARASRDPVSFAAFIALFPQLIAGPVLRYKDLEHQFSSRIHSSEKFTEGVTRFMQGFIKKVFIADSIAPLADTAFALETPTAADAWLGALAYTAQLYFDFSGYSDMAIGLGLMMGFRFMENFNQPYVSQSITEFWRRWHISLSTWLRDYLYVPLGGNRHGTARTYRNLSLTMLLGGLWHGANWTFVVWGAWHGALLAIERALGLKADVGAGFRPLRWAVTFVLVVIGWVFFRADSLEDAFRFLGAMFSFDGLGLSPLYAQDIGSLHLYSLALAGGVLLWGGWRVRRAARAPSPPVDAPVLVSRVSPTTLLLLPLFALAVLKLSAQSYSPFLYFRF